MTAGPRDLDFEDYLDTVFLPAWAPVAKEG